MPQILMIIILLVASVIGLVSVKYLGDDNPIEEISEEIIKVETGVTIDLTPLSPEIH